jgi:hypothetical protein
LDVGFLVFQNQFLHSCCVPTHPFCAGPTGPIIITEVRTFPNCVHHFLICYPVITPSPYCCVIRQSISIGEMCFTFKQKTKSLYELLCDTNLLLSLSWQVNLSFREHLTHLRHLLHIVDTTSSISLPEN